MVTKFPKLDNPQLGLLDELQRFEDAIAAYDKAIEFKQDDREAWNNRGNTLRNLGRFEDATYLRFRS